MGQIIRLPVMPAEFPDNTTALDPAERLLLSAIRWWNTDFDQHDDPLPRSCQARGLCQARGAAGAHDAAFTVDQLMAVFVRFARRPLAIHCLCCSDLSDDERHLLNVASLVQAGDSKLAERALRTALLSAQGAEFALTPLRTLGELFAEAKLLFRPRLPAAQFGTSAIEPWSPMSPPAKTY